MIVIWPASWYLSAALAPPAAFFMPPPCSRHAELPATSRQPPFFCSMNFRVAFRAVGGFTAVAAHVRLASMAVVTPMMRQYQEAKRACPDALLLFRMGDFYEMFHDDAKVAAHAQPGADQPRKGARRPHGRLPPTINWKATWPS